MIFNLIYSHRVPDQIRGLVDSSQQSSRIPANVRVELRGMVNNMEPSFKSFGLGFILSFVLLFLILIAQFRSFLDPFLIVLAIPMGFIGVLIVLPLTHTTMNVMSVGVLMLVGIAAYLLVYRNRPRRTAAAEPAA